MENKKERAKKWHRKVPNLLIVRDDPVYEFDICSRMGDNLSKNGVLSAQCAAHAYTHTHAERKKEREKVNEDEEKRV